MRLLTLILILIAPLAIADTFQGRDYELFDVRTKARPAPLILNLHGAGSTAPRLPGSTALQRTTMSSSPTHPRQPIAGMTGAGGPLGKTDLAAQGVAAPIRSTPSGIQTAAASRNPP